MREAPGAGLGEIEAVYRARLGQFQRVVLIARWPLICQGCLGILTARGVQIARRGVVTETLYEHAGGDEGLRRLEELFYDKVLGDPLLKTLFKERMPTHVDHLTWFTAESFGGPGRFTESLGFQHLIDVHRGLRITDEQRDRFAELYMEALDEAGLPDDAPFRQAVREHVEFGVRVAQQNSWAETDADLHPIRAVPRWQWPATRTQTAR
jgi:hemoglobin